MTGCFHIASARRVTASALYLVRAAAAAAPEITNSATMAAMYAKASSATSSANRSIKGVAHFAIGFTLLSMGDKRRAGVTEMSSFCYFS